jgi:hypothetical protein
LDTEIAPGSPAVKRRRHPLGSRIASGATLLPNVDGRSVWARLVQNTLLNLQAHCGGVLSETRRLAAPRVSVLEAELVFLEDEFAAARLDGREPDPAKIDLYGRLSDRQRRLAEAALGWQPTPRDVTTFGDIIRADQEAERERARLAIQEAPS